MPSTTRTFRKLGVEMPVKFAEAHDVANALARLAESAPAGGLLGSDDVEIGVTVSYNVRSSRFSITIANQKFNVSISK